MGILHEVTETAIRNLVKIITAARETKSVDDYYDFLNRELDLQFYDTDDTVVHSSMLLDVLNDYYDFECMHEDQLAELLPLICDNIGLEYKVISCNEDSERQTSNYLIRLLPPLTQR